MVTVMAFPPSWTRSCRALADELRPSLLWPQRYRKPGHKGMWVVAALPPSPTSQPGFLRGQACGEEIVGKPTLAACHFSNRRFSVRLAAHR